MAADTVIRARIDTATKAQASAALSRMGLTVSDAIRLLMIRVAEEQRLPFEIRTPNRQTARAIRELERGEGEAFTNVESLFADLGV